MKSEIFCGVGTALITPHKNGRIDYNALAGLIERQIEAGTEALIIGGTTGEAATLTPDERSELYSFSRDVASGRCKIIFGTGSNDTSLAVKYTEEAEKIGCDGVLVVTPYYNKGTAEGVVKHYETIAKCTVLPIILYNVPQRTGVDLSLEAVQRLSTIQNIVAIKEASGSSSRLRDLARIQDIGLYAGNDADSRAVISLGGLGVISVISNLYPKAMHNLITYQRQGLESEAEKTEAALTPIIKAMFLDTNPAPLKYALSRLGLCTGEMRLPMYEISDRTKEIIDGLITGVEGKLE